MVYHIRDIVILVTDVVKLKDAVIIQPTLFAFQSLFVLQKFLSVFIDTFLGFAPGHS
jgi:hypothetical protein